MNFLEERIVKDGIVKPGNVLKVDSFLNHQMDIRLMQEIGREFKRRFGHKNITKVMTIEASGIAIAYPVAREFGVPMVFAKKANANLGAAVERVKIGKVYHSGSFAVLEFNDKTCLTLGVEVCCLCSCCKGNSYSCK